MLSANQSVFSFELNETVCFSKGQEIAEIKGISLEPNISIQSYSDYISIRGVIELTGEYKKERLLEEEDRYIDFEDFEAKRYVEKVTDLEDDDAAFYHRFPVEISVPAYRVDELDNVSISIDAFDYDLPDNSQLNLFATIQIHGINEEEAQLERMEEKKQISSIGQNQTEELNPNDTQDHSEEFMNLHLNEREEPILARHEEEKQEDLLHLEQERENDQDDKQEAVDDQPIEKEQSEAENEASDRTETEQDTFQFEVIQEQTDEDAESTDQYPEAEDVSYEEADDEPERWPFKEKTQTLAEFLNTQTSKQQEQETQEFLEQDENISDSTDREDDNREETEEVSSLSDIFRHTEEESYTKMRICIVQEDDTIDTIAERFQVSPLQLIKQNKLTEDFDVEPGQLLYIPVKK